MTIIELFFFLALPTSVAFCFVFPLHDAFRLAAVIGGASAVLSAASLFVFGAAFRLLRGHWPGGAAFTPWALVASVLATGGAILVCWRVPIALFGIIALAATSLGVYGTGRWSVVGWSSLVVCVIVALIFHVVLPTSAV